MPDAPPAGARARTAADPVSNEDARLLRHVGRGLVAWSGLATFLVLVVLGVALYGGVARALEASSVAQLETRASPFRELVERPDTERFEPPSGFVFGSGPTFPLLVTPDDRILGPRSFDIPVGLPDRDSVDAARSTGRDVRTAIVQQVPIRILSLAVDNPRAGRIVIQVVADRTAEVGVLDTLLVVLVVGGMGAVLLSVGFGAAYSRRALAPIRASLAARQAALARQRQFAADASHELRTPLTVVTTSLEHLRRNPDETVSSVGTALEDIGAEVGHLGRLVDDLLLLARSDSGAITLDRVRVDLGDLASDAVAGLTGQAAARGVRLVAAVEPVMLTGDPVRLRQVALILASNAIQHAPGDSEVRVIVRDDTSVAVLTVEDEGPGIRPDDLPHVFDRFWRAPDAPTGGTGLGLSIAAWIVGAHGGSIAAGNRESGGARFTIRIPKSLPPRES